MNTTVLDHAFTPFHAAVLGGALLAVQYLVVYGTRFDAAAYQGRTPAQFASSQNKPELAQWLNAVSGWSQLRVAAGCWFYKVAKLLLQQGQIDPDDLATTSIKDIMAVVATSNEKPAALPWRNAPQICKATVKRVADATRGWHRTTHWLHHTAVRDAVFAVLVVAGRLQMRDIALQLEAMQADESAGVDAPPPAAAAAATAVAADADTDANGDGGNGALEQPPLLPGEVWFYVMRFFKRSWWPVV